MVDLADELRNHNSHKRMKRETQRRYLSYASGERPPEDRYQRQRLEDNAHNIETLMNDMRQRERGSGASGGVKLERPVRVKRETSDNPRGREIEMEDYQESVSEPACETAGGTAGETADVFKSCDEGPLSPQDAAAPAPAAFDGSDAFSDRWWLTWEEADFQAALDYYNDLVPLSDADSMLSELKRLVGRDAKRMIQDCFLKSVQKTPQAEPAQPAAPVRAETPKKARSKTKYQETPSPTVIPTNTGLPSLVRYVPPPVLSPRRFANYDCSDDYVRAHEANASGESDASEEENFYWKRHCARLAGKVPTPTHDEYFQDTSLSHPAYTGVSRSRGGIRDGNRDRVGNGGLSKADFRGSFMSAGVLDNPINLDDSVDSVTLEDSVKLENGLVPASATPSLVPPSEMQLTDEQQRIFDLVALGQNVFFTGGAGTGKSVLIRQIASHASKDGRTATVTAPTGLAAVNVGGQTIHRWAGLGLMMDSEAVSIRKVMTDPAKAARWKFTDLLIIDEVSMVSARMFQLIDAVARHVRSHYVDIVQLANGLAAKRRQERKEELKFAHLDRTRNYVKSGESKGEHLLAGVPFGGMQVVCVGDFFQLPPVPSMFDKNDFTKRTGSTNAPPSDYLFYSPTFREMMGARKLRLTVAQRQSDGSEFAQMLSMFRKYRGTPDEVRTLTAYFSRFSGDFGAHEEKVFLRPSNKSVELTNVEELAKLDGPEVTYHSMDFRNYGPYSDQQIAQGMQEISADEVVRVKPGAQIMYLQNDYEEGLVNGHMGVVAFLMTAELYVTYYQDLPELYALSKMLAKREIRSLSTLVRPPEFLEGEVTRERWGYLRFALMHIDEEYRQKAVAQKKALAELNKTPTTTHAERHKTDTDLVPVFRLSDEHVTRGKQFFQVAQKEFECVDYSKDDSKVLTPEELEELRKDPNYRVICRRTQLPIVLAWALTIHKSQGQTLIRALVDMKGVFMAGQAYVAMSRVREPADLKLLNFQLPQMPHIEVQEFDQTIIDALDYRICDDDRIRRTGPVAKLEDIHPGRQSRNLVAPRSSQGAPSGDFYSSDTNTSLPGSYDGVPPR